MNTKTLNRAFGLLAFVVALVVYLLTAQDSVPFWDCGEFSAATTWQQVPHPPGAPLFLMMGKVFQVLIPFGDPGWRVNVVSAFASALTIMFLYFITVMAIRNFRLGKEETFNDSLAIFGSALVGALAYTFSDTFWFNAVESEVYASSSMFTAIVVYLMMKWNEQADNPGNEKYLLLIAYFMGLSTGVHLLALLTLFSIVYVVYFRKYKFTVKSFIWTSILSILIFFIIYPGIVMYLPSLLAGHFLKNEIGEYALEGPYLTIITLLIIAGVVWAFYYAHKRNKPILKLSTLAFLLMLFGYTTYAHILLRSNANPPMNENEPKNFAGLTSYLGREQYGDQKMWPRRTDFQDQQKVDIYNLKDENGEYVYGEWIPPTTKEVHSNKTGESYGVPTFEDVNVAGELSYMMKYQVYHMFIRYFLWNFVGRASDVQDAPPALFDKTEAQNMNYKSGYSDIYPIRFFALPLIFGLFGMLFHFWKDPKMAFAQMVMFLMMGILADLEQNQQKPQPRERDYFYAGAFYIFALWIGIGVYGIIDWISKNKLTTAKTTGIVALSLILVPINMAVGGWKMHDRSGNFLPFDYSYNILQSTEKDAILFTNGDNDTFPVWYLQDVMGIRRDVRVVNLSLGNTLWYVDQLKNREPWGAQKIPLSFSDNILQVPEDDPNALKYEYGPAQNITIPVRPEILRQYTNNEDYIKAGKFQFTFVGKQESDGGQPAKDKNGNPIYLFHIHNKLILDILKQTKFERPVYFSITTGSEVYSGLNRYLRLEGMAQRVLPVPVDMSTTGPVDIDRMCQNLLNVDNSNNFSKEPKYGFKFRNLNNRSVFFDDVHRKLMGSYRTLFFQLASYIMQKEHNSAKAEKVLETMNQQISIVQFPLLYDEELKMAMIYKEIGNTAKSAEFAQHAIKTCTEIIQNPRYRDSDRWGRIPSISDELLGVPGVYKTEADAYVILHQYDAAKKTLMTFLDQVKQSMSNSNMAKYDRYLQRNIMDIMSQLYSIDESEIRALEDSGYKSKALARAKELADQYSKSNDPILQRIAGALTDRIHRMEGGEDTAQIRHEIDGGGSSNNTAATAPATDE